MIHSRKPQYAFFGGMSVSILGGLIGLGGAEFRLPLLVGFFGFSTLLAVMINKLTSLATVIFAFAFRSYFIDTGNILAHVGIVMPLIIGCMTGALLGAHYACKLKESSLNVLIAFILLILATSMIASSIFTVNFHHPNLTGLNLMLVGFLAGVIIGVIAAVLGVAGGEFLIPTLILLYGFDMKVAGTLSLCVSLPTMLVAFARFSREQVFQEIASHKIFVIFMIIGSFVGAFIGAYGLRFIHSEWLIWALGVILMVSAIKVFLHANKQTKSISKT